MRQLRRSTSKVNEWARALIRILVGLSVALLTASISNHGFSQDQQPLKSIEAIHKVDNEDLGKSPPIDLECIVTYYDPDWPILFIHDGKDGGYAGNPRSLTVKSGDKIRIRGTLNSQRVPEPATFEPSNNSIDLPMPKPVSSEWLQAGNEDSQTVSIEAQLVGVNYEHFQHTLEMRTEDGGRFRGLLRQENATVETLKNLLGRHLRLQGVVGARFNEEGLWSGFQIWLRDFSCIEVIERPGEPFVLPITPISSLTSEEVVRTKSSYFRTVGRAAYQLSPSMLLLRDNDAQLFVEVQNPRSIQLDRSYEVAGTLDTSVLPSILRMAELTPSNQHFEFDSPSVFHSIELLVTGNHSGEIVRTTGTYAGSLKLKDQSGFLMEYQGTMLPVLLNNESLGKVAVGTTIEVEGVWVQQKSLVGFNIGSCAIHARKDGIVVGTQVPWSLLGVLATALFVTLASSIWAATLRREVKKRTEQFLDSVARERETEERYASIFIQAQVMVMTADQHGKLATVNPAAVRLTKLPEQALLHSNLRSLVTAESVPSLESLLQSADESGQVVVGQVKLKTAADEIVPQEVSCWVTRDGAQKLFHLIWHDISERLRVEQQRTDIEQRMLANQKLESLGALAGGIAHDFNNLLAVIVGNASLLSEAQLTKPEHEQVESIQDAAKRASELTLQMLAYAGRGRFDIRVADLSQLVSEMSTLLQASVPKSVPVEFNLEAGLSGVRIDATQFKQILLNFVRNASEAMEGRSGKIRVETYSVSKLPIPSEKSILSDFMSEDAKQNGLICLEVRDDGCGIDQSILASVFDPFFSTKFSGRGLGLATVIGIARGHQACLEVQSQLGVGTIFRVYFASCREPVTPIPSPHFSTTRADRNIKVVVVDDELAVLSILARMLEGASFQVSKCRSADEALQLIDAPDFECDILITDQTMPKMSGLELCRVVKRKRPHLPTILCSGYSISDAQEIGDASVVDAVLQKPFQSSQLIKMVSDLVNSSSRRPVKEASRAE